METTDTNLVENEPNIPDFIADEEQLIRILFVPKHINIKSDNVTLKTYIFKPPVGSEDISVNRADYTTEDACINQGLQMSRPPKNTFWGLAYVLVQDIRDLGFEVHYSPRPHNPAHADIKIGFVVKEGEPLPPNINFKITLLLEKVKAIPYE
ncbi:MAG: hypothetical protein ACKVTZ_00485 [Bacteroidia bacterium]